MPRQQGKDNFISETARKQSDEKAVVHGYHAFVCADVVAQLSCCRCYNEREYRRCCDDAALSHTHPEEQLRVT